MIHTLEWARIEEFVPVWHGIGRPPKDRSALANGFVAKAVLGLTTTVALIDRLTVDRALRRICGFSRWKKLPDEATFSRLCRVRGGSAGRTCASSADRSAPRNRTDRPHQS